MKRAILFLCLLVFPLILRAQEEPISVTYTVKDDKSVEFNYSKKVAGSCSILIEFSSLSNSSYYSSPIVLKNSSGRLFTLKPVNPNRGIGFSYGWRYVQGNIKPKIREGFVYALPFENGKSVEVIELSNLYAQYFGSEKPKDWKAYRFTASKGSSIHAVRRGIVVKTEEGQAIPANGNFTSEVASVTVEHEDGSYAIYKGVKNIEVEIGQDLLPGDLVGNLGDSPHLHFSVYHWHDYDFKANREQGMQKAGSNFRYLTPLFLTKEGTSTLKPKQTYHAFLSEEMLTEEMSKREIKKMKKQQGN